jgi:hypothetical protein
MTSSTSLRVMLSRRLVPMSGTTCILSRASSSAAEADQGPERGTREVQSPRRRQRARRAARRTRTLAPLLRSSSARARAAFRARRRQDLLPHQRHRPGATHDAILAMVALGCGVGVVPELVRKDSPLRGRIGPSKCGARRAATMCRCARRAARCRGGRWERCGSWRRARRRREERTARTRGARFPGPRRSPWVG